MKAFPSAIESEPDSRPTAGRLTWRNLRWAALATFVLVLAIVFFWSRSTFAVRLVVLTTVLGASAALLCGLTFWHNARVQIGRRGLRFKAVRRIAAIAAAFNLSFLFIWTLSTLTTVRRDDNTTQSSWTISLRSGLPVAIAHLHGDENHQVEQALVRGLEPSKSKLPVKIIAIDQTFDLIRQCQSFSTIWMLPIFFERTGPS
jgi:hypothetical protein